MRFNIFNEIDKETAKFFEKYIPATETDPSCRTAAYQARIDEMRDYLIEHPEELLEVDTDALTAIYKNHHGDLLELGENIHRYYVGLAEEQAEDYTE